MTNLLTNIGVAQIKTASSPGILRTILGSCVGVCIYDRMKKIGGMAHILLPSNLSDSTRPEKFADTAVPMLVKQLIGEGARKEFLSAKIAGGASMFKFGANTMLGQIGDKNVEMVKNVLSRLGIPIVAEDTGGNSGRVIDFFLEDGRMRVKTMGQEKYYYKI
ncbi:MAG: chemotaxis protein CheD [Spirochaetes bacterium]|jgi:chemotaxis protein CheD|nr:chemotaxis protein CheD [Spirochaetota bacterium]